MFKLNRIYTGLIGDGSLMGFPAIIVKFQGCNINCTFCNDEDTKDFNKGRDILFAELVDDIKKLLKGNPNIKKVLITGGEPLLQDLNELALLPHAIPGCSFILDTSGLYFDLDIFSTYSFISMDIKKFSDLGKELNNIDVVSQTLRLFSHKMELKSPINYIEDYQHVRPIFNNVKMTYPNVPLIITQGYYRKPNVPFWNYLRELTIKDGFRLVLPINKILGEK